MNQRKDSPSEVLKMTRLAIPVVLSYVGNITMGLIDTFVAGRAGSHVLAGVAAGANIFFPLMAAGIGFLSALDPIVSQAYGAKDWDRCQQGLRQGIRSAWMLSLPFTLAVMILGFFYSSLGTSPEVTQPAQDFIRGVVWSMPLILVYTAYFRFWQAMHVTLPVLVITVAANVANYFLDVGFVNGAWGLPKLDALGVGIATTLCRIFMLIAMVAFTHWKLRQLGWKKCKTPIPASMASDFLKIGLPAGALVGLEVGAFGLATFMAARFGVIPLAAHQIVLQMASLTFMFPLGLSVAGAVRVGALIGEGKPALAGRTGWSVLFLGAFMMAISAFLMLTRGDQWIGWFSNDPEVVRLASQILVLAGIFQIFDGVQTVGAGILRGAGETKLPMLINLIGHYPVGLTLGLVFAFTLKMNVPGIWIGLTSGLIFVSVGLTWVWHQKVKKLTSPPQNSSATLPAAESHSSVD